MNYDLKTLDRKKRQVLTTPPHSIESVETNYEPSDQSSNISTRIHDETSIVVYITNQEPSITMIHDNNYSNVNEQHDDDEHNLQQTISEEDSHESNFGNNTIHPSVEIDDIGQSSNEESQHGIQSNNPTSSIATEPGESEWDMLETILMNDSIVHKTGQNSLSSISQDTSNTSTAPNEPSLQQSDVEPPRNEPSFEQSDVVPPPNGHCSQNNTNRDGYISFPITPEKRYRYIRELVSTTPLRNSQITFMLNELNLVFGPPSAFSGGYAEITLLARTNDGRYIYSPHKFYDSTMDLNNELSNQRYVEIGSYNNDLTIKKNLVTAVSCQKEFVNANHPRNTYRNQQFEIKYYPSGKLQSIRGLKPREIFRKYNLYGMYLGIRPASPNPNGGFSVEPDAPIIYSNCFSHVGQRKINLNDEKYKFQISHMTVNVTDSPYPGTFQWSITCGIQIPEPYHCALKSGYLWLEMKIKKPMRASFTFLSADWSTPDKIYFNIDNKAHNLAFDIIMGNLPVNRSSLPATYQNSASVPVNNEDALFSLQLTMCHVETGTDTSKVFETSVTKLNGVYSENGLELKKTPNQMNDNEHDG
ncbi:unnamed protein product [Adineta steineri]|nr:unnamed protein product [Adineta steineri]